MSRLEERVRRAIENMIENSSLSDDLMDAEAQVLLDWGQGVVHRIFSQSSEPDGDGEGLSPVEDAGLTSLRQTMRRAGRLVGNIAHDDAEKAQKRIEKFLESARSLPAYQVAAPDDLQAAAQELQALPSGEALQRILSWITSGEGQQNDL